MKRLIVCCDGTWNTPEMPCPTNVVKFLKAVKPEASDGTAQLVYYGEGVGTKWLNKWTGGAFGWGIDENIQAAYLFLCANYEPGDEVYLLGFSRGAYTVRSLAGLIYCSGLLAADKIDKIPQAYNLYRDRAIKPSNPIAETFRRENGDRIPITMLGCWDTVGALGVPNVIPLIPMNQLFNKKYQFHDTELSAIIQNACHAVAIDEIREPFNVTLMQRSQNPKAVDQVLRQIWFPGDHGCVGGGTESYRGLSDATLQWMMDSIRELGLGLEFDPARLDLAPDPAIDFNNRPRFPFSLAKTIQRQVNNGFEALHTSVLKRWHQRSDYRPTNLEIYRAQLDASHLPVA